MEKMFRLPSLKELTILKKTYSFKSNVLNLELPCEFWGVYEEENTPYIYSNSIIFNSVRVFAARKNYRADVFAVSEKNFPGGIKFADVYWKLVRKSANWYEANSAIDALNKSLEPDYKTINGGVSLDKVEQEINVALESNSKTIDEIFKERFIVMGDEKRMTYKEMSCWLSENSSEHREWKRGDNSGFIMTTLTYHSDEENEEVDERFRIRVNGGEWMEPKKPKTSAIEKLVKEIESQPELEEEIGIKMDIERILFYASQCPIKSPLDLDNTGEIPTDYDLRQKQAEWIYNKMKEENEE